MENPAGMEEWDIENELVHRLAHLLLLRRFGQQPFWLTMGFSWYVEKEMRGAIYCYPYRSGFVWASEHELGLLVRGPGVPRGRVSETPVQLVDVAPTILALAGLAPLDDPDGHDLTPLMHGDAGAPRLAYLETLATQMDLGWSPLLGVRSASHKYIRAPRPELYELTGELQSRRS